MTKLGRLEIQEYLKRSLGLSPTVSKKKNHAYGSGEPFYLKSKAEAFSVAVHPKWAEALRRGAVAGVRARSRPNRSSGYIAFPKGLTGRGRMQHEACDLEFEDYPALLRLLRFIGVSPQPDGDRDPTLEIEEASSRGEFDGLSTTEREAVIKARRGQGAFRNQLDVAWGNACSVTGVGIQALLRASHIKPWRNSTNQERLDSDNGLLLVATLDAAFDAGLIAFTGSGGILYSPELGSSPADTLGISPAARMRRAPSLQQQAYLEHHRTVLFRG